MLCDMYDIKQQVKQEMGIEDSLTSNVPSGLNAEETEAYNYAVEQLKVDPNDSTALEILNMLNNDKMRTAGNLS